MILQIQTYDIIVLISLGVRGERISSSVNLFHYFGTNRMCSWLFFLRYSLSGSLYCLGLGLEQSDLHGSLHIEGASWWVGL